MNEGPTWQGQMRLYLSSQRVFLDLRVKPNEEKHYLKKKKLTGNSPWSLPGFVYVFLACKGNLACLSLDLAKCSSNPTDLVVCLQPNGF